MPADQGHLVHPRQPSSSEPGFYSYAELAARIADVLFVRPSVSTLRAAAAESRRTTATNARIRLTSGMPAPVTTKRGRAQFDREAVEAWLARHPRRVTLQAVKELTTAAAAGADLEQAVHGARRAGLSWRTITDGLAAGGHHRSVAAVHKTFRGVDQPGPEGAAQPGSTPEEHVSSQPAGPRGEPGPTWSR